MRTLVFTPAAYRIFKKFTPDLKKEILKKAETLKKNPLEGESLRGKYSKYRSLHFSYKGVAYRIIYQVFLKEKQVAILLAAKRENIYKRLEEMGV